MPNICLAIPPEMAPGVAGLELPGICCGAGCSCNILAVYVEVAGDKELGNRELLICSSTSSCLVPDYRCSLPSLCCLQWISWLRAPGCIQPQPESFQVCFLFGFS